MEAWTATGPRPRISGTWSGASSRSWTVGENPGLWCEFHPLKARVPDGGFKIHLSITHEHASDLLTAVVPIFVEEGVSFKVLVDERILDFSNSTFWGRGACGKFVTIYAADNEQLKRLLPRLHEATKGFQGPYILSDKRYKDSKVIFYRFGAFRRAQRVNVFGEPIALVRLADGSSSRTIGCPTSPCPRGWRTRSRTRRRKKKRAKTPS